MFNWRGIAICVSLLLFSLTGLAHSQGWAKITTTGSSPTSRFELSSVYDTTNNRMIIFGGDDFVLGGALNETWVLSNANGLGGTPSWTLLTTTGSQPTPRRSHSAVYDDINNRMIIYGGESFNFATTYDDVWVLDHANGLGGSPSWTEITTSGSLPPLRASHSAILDSSHNLMTIYGGSNDTDYLNDVWVLSAANGMGVSSWTQLNPTGNNPTKRGVHSTIYDSANNLMTIFGGYNGSSQLNDTWVLSNANGQGGTPAWTQLFPTGSIPTTRYGHSAIYDSVNNQMVAYGGIHFGIGGLNDIWSLGNANGIGGTPSWAQVTVTGNTTYSHGGHTAAYDPPTKRMIVFGEGSNDVWVLNLNPIPPILSNFPGLKLFVDQGLPNAFALEDYNTGTQATSYSIFLNFLSLASLTGSTTGQATYGMATAGTNFFFADNTYGEGTGSSPVKYTHYKIAKLPKVGLTVGNSFDLNMANYTSDSSGLAIAASFGASGSIINSDTTKVSATWIGNILRLTSLSSFTSPISVDVIASPNTGPNFGEDIDMERIWVYNNILGNSTFSTANDTTAFIAQSVPGYGHLPVLNWYSTATDNTGSVATGIINYSFVDNTYGGKITLQQPYWQSYQNGQWYTIRARVFSPDVNNNHQFLLYNYGGLPGQGHVDLVANIYFGIPSTWIWIEAPLYSHSAASGYLQYHLKGDSTGSVSIDEFQIIDAAPQLIDMNRSNSRLKYSAGYFNNTSDATSGFAIQQLGATQGVPQSSISNGVLQFDFSEASSNHILGMKMTAAIGGLNGTIDTPSATIGKEVGTRTSIQVQSGSFNSVNSLILLAAYGVNSSGGFDFFNQGHIISIAEFGEITGSDSVPYWAIAKAKNPYYQFQFQAKNDAPGILSIDNVDLIRDMDDPNYGDGALFP